MLALTLNVVFAVTFGHIMKWATHRGANLLWVTACNYLAASVLCSLIAVVAPPHGALAFTIITGVWAGVCYLGSLLYYFAAIRRLGMSLATSAIRISTALPVVAALLFWHERLQPAQDAGLVLVAFALLLLGRSDRDATRTSAGLLVTLILPLFFITGAGQLGARIYSGGAPAANIYLYSAALFGGAAVAALLALARRPQPLRRQDVGLGVLLGLNNTLTNVCLLLALRALPSAVVFSVSSAASVALAAVTGWLLWGERLNRPAIGAIAAATAAVALLAR